MHIDRRLAVYAGDAQSWIRPSGFTCIGIGKSPT
jgi:hypothetical protein